MSKWALAVLKPQPPLRDIAGWAAHAESPFYERFWDKKKNWGTGTRTPTNGSRNHRAAITPFPSASRLKYAILGGLSRVSAKYSGCTSLILAL